MYRIRLAGLLDWLESVVFPKCCWYLELFIPFICLIHYFLFLLPRSLFFSLLKTTHQYALHFVFLWENIYVIFLLGQYVYKPPWYYFILPLSLYLSPCYSLSFSPNVYLHLILISSSNFVSHNQLAFPFRCMKVHQLKNLDYPHIFDDSGECSCRNKHILRKNKCT